MSDEQPIPHVPADQSPSPKEETTPTAPRTRKKQMGRPRAEINWDTVDGMMFCHATLREVADYFAVSEDTIERACLRERKQTFAELFKHKSAGAKVSLRRAIWDSALRRRDSRLLVHLAKHVLGEGDHVAVEVRSMKIPADVDALTLEELDRQIHECLVGLDLERLFPEAERVKVREALDQERARLAESAKKNGNKG